MTPTLPRRKLIEVSLPLEAINEEARRRKQKAPKGYPTSIHKYWAQRPIAACRAVLFAQLVDDPSSWPDRYATVDEQDLERKRLHKLIERLVPWDASNIDDVLHDAKWEIARSIAWDKGAEPPPKHERNAVSEYLQANAPVICDPFSGAASISLEAQRLGLRSRGSDLNSVAVLIGKALVEIPPKFARQPPVNPAAQAELRHGGHWNGRGAEGLAEDVRHYARWIRAEANRRLEDLYPQVTLDNGSQATVIAWMWTRTVRSPDPSANGAHVPLVSSFLLSTHGQRKAWIEIVIDPDSRDGYRFDVHTGYLSDQDAKRLKSGTKTGRGANFRCVLSGAPITDAYVRSEGMAGRLGQRLMAIIADAKPRRIYLSPTSDHEDAAACEASDDVEGIAIEMSANPRWFSPPFFGFRRYSDLFTNRQLRGLLTLSNLVGDVHRQIMQDAATSQIVNDPRDYADAVATCLSLAVGRVALYGSALCRWLTKDNAIGAAIPQKAIEMAWDFAEANLLATSSASIEMCARNVANCISAAPCNRVATSQIEQFDARHIQLSYAPIFNTDPPYFSNVGYADISDYFYIWHRRSLINIYPNLFRRLTTNKTDELVAIASRERKPSELPDADWEKLDREAKAELFFLYGMRDVFIRMHDLADPKYPIIVYYAFRESAEHEEGSVSTGWSAILQSLFDAGFSVEGTWPLRTESSAALKTEINTLASSIVLVCRKRALAAPIVTRAEFIRALRTELPEAIAKIRNAGVGPVDMQQAVIGPGMGVFSRHGKVLEDDDSAMSVRTALMQINRVWEEIESDLDAAFDAETQVALAWFATYGFDAKPSGELITLANAKNVPLGALFASGVFTDGRGKAGLTARGELPPGWTPATDRSPTVWECVQHTARVLAAEDGGGEAAAQLVAEMGPQASAARALAYRLYEISSQKGWQQEALVYNELAQEWPKLEDRALMQQTLRETATLTQGRLL